MEKILYIKEDGVRFRKIPDISNRENIICELPKGQEMVVIEEPWVKVKLGEEVGWVRTDYILETNPNNSAITVQNPLSFIVGQENLADNPLVIKLREVIGDEFNLGKFGNYLNCTEYVMYKIKTKLGITIQWPVKSGRNGGIWWKIFQNAGIYKTLTEPKVNCAMCFTEVRKKDGTVTNEGHIAFVEEVFADDSLKVSEANWPGDGIYNERKISKSDWQNKYKARFVEFV